MKVSSRHDDASAIVSHFIGGMMRSKVILVLLSGLLFTMVGCPAINYKPFFILDPSPKTIKARVSLSKFVDQTPSDDRDTKLFGVSVTEPRSLEGELAIGVTNALLSGFRHNWVFDVIEKNLDNADFIINGRIQRFTGKAGPNVLFWFTLPINLIWFFGLPIESLDAEVQLEMVVVRPDGTEVGRYTGRSHLSEWFSMYGGATLAAPRYTNTAFANAVQQIREQLLADESKLTKR